MSFHDDISLDHEEVTYLVRCFAVSVLAIAFGVVTLVTAALLSLR